MTELYRLYTFRPDSRTLAGAQVVTATTSKLSKHQFSWPAVGSSINNTPRRVSGTGVALSEADDLLIPAWISSCVSHWITDCL